MIFHIGKGMLEYFESRNTKRVNMQENNWKSLIFLFINIVKQRNIYDTRFME